MQFIKISIHFGIHTKIGKFVMKLSSYCIYVTTIVYAALITIASANEIEWELNFPFRQMGKLSLGADATRYFADPDIGERNWNFRRDLYVDKDCIGRPRPILCSERKIGELRVNKMRELIKSPPRSEYGTTKNNAWLAEAFIDRGNAYSASQFRYRNNYILTDHDKTPNGHPHRHRIRVWMKGKKYENRKCEFRVLHDTSWYLADCLEGTDKLSIARGQNSSTLQARILGGEQIVSLRGNETQVREVIVAAVGDSYASGEGVPDIPAQIEFVDGDVKRKEAIGLGSRELRSAYNAAHWVERNCHRSFLSSQARAVIHYAAAHPKTETTMLHVACSGAEVISGLLGPYSGATETNWMKRRLEENGHIWRTTLSQYNQIILALCKDPDIKKYQNSFRNYFESRIEEGLFGRTVKKIYAQNGRSLPIQELDKPGAFDKLFAQKIDCRGGFKKEIDALLVGVGGNDVGFFDAVKHVLLDAGIIRAGSGALKPSEAGKLAKERIGALYKLLDEANTTWLGVDRARIIVSLYPLGVTDSNGSFCESSEGLGSFNVLGKIFGLRLFANLAAPNVTKEESSALHDEFGGVLNEEIVSYAKKNPGWRVSREHVDWFKGHGWCAGNASIKRDGSYNPFKPSDRWIRTPDDGYASQHRLPVDFEKKRSNLMNEMLKTYGLMHPNGLGAAAMADSYYRHLVQVLEN